MYTALLRKSSGLLSSDDVTRYIDFVRQLPRLSSDEEAAAIIKYRQEGDEEARSSLICSTLWLGVWISRRFRFMGDHQADFIQESSIGIIKALGHFDPNNGVRFSTFANIYVKAEAHNYMVANWRMVKVATTKAKRKVFHNLFKHVGVGDRLTDAKIAQIATQLNVQDSDVRAVHGHMAADTRMGMPLNSDGLCIEDQLTCDDYCPERMYFDAAEIKTNGLRIGRALKVLSEREADVIASRITIDEPVVLETLSERYSVSKERIRQIQALALRKMRCELEAA
jgi:RNA polymerase sigma-32 factor